MSIAKKVLLSVTLALILLGCVLGATYADSSCQVYYYTVQPGDSLYRIAYRYGVSVYDLAEANGLTNLNVIYSGQVLVIVSCPPATVPVPLPVRYVPPPRRVVVPQYYYYPYNCYYYNYNYPQPIPYCPSAPIVR